MAKKYWMSRMKIHGGSLHDYLGVPKDEKIPCGFLDEIDSTKIGEIANNPTGVGKKKIRVTNKLKKEAVLAKTLKRIHGQCKS
jgi:hypothetical protein